MKFKFDCGCTAVVHDKVSTHLDSIGEELDRLDYCALHGAAQELQSACAHVLTTLVMGLQPGGTDRRMLVAALEQSGRFGRRKA